LEKYLTYSDYKYILLETTSQISNISSKKTSETHTIQPATVLPNQGRNALDMLCM